MSKLIYTKKYGSQLRKMVLPAFICGYGFGLLNMGWLLGKYINDPIICMLLMALGLFFALSGFFWHYCDKPYGLLDRLMDKTMAKTWGVIYDPYTDELTNKYDPYAGELTKLNVDPSETKH